MGWLALLGAAMWTVLIVCSYLHWRNPHAEPDACPECLHDAGLNSRRTHCKDATDNNGWSTTRCPCQNDYHWNVESVQAG